MKVLFIIEPPKNKAIYLTYLQPLGVLYIASYLESKNIDTEVIDFNVEPNKEFNLSKYDLIGYSVTSANIENTLVSIKKIKSANPKIKIVVGGPFISLAPEKLISMKEIDALIDGEAEDILYNFMTKKNKKNILGLWIKINGKPYFTGKSKPIHELDSLPFPNFEKVPLEKYNVVLKKRSPVAGIITSRGCPYSCIFCYHALGFKFRARSPENVISEIKRDIDLGVKELWIADDNFTFDMERVRKICDLIIGQQLDITFTIANGVRADRLDEPLLRKLKKAGCWLLAISPESGNEESLKKMYKGFTLDHALSASRLCKKVGIRTMANFIIGFPWEKEKEILQTIEFAKKLDCDINHFSRMIPFPGTPLWEMSHKADYELKDEAHNYGGLRYNHPFIDEETFTRLVKKAYQQTMLTPNKIFNLATLLRPSDFFTLARYSLLTKSV